MLFPSARAPEAALAGLWLYFSCLDESHSISQDVHTPEGSFWPDPGNAGYWFRRAGNHPVFPALRDAAESIAGAHSGVRWIPGASWDPFAFIDACEQARREKGSELENVMLEIQRAEWQLLFDYCARRAQ